jgi:5'-nucleotidase
MTAENERVALLDMDSSLADFEASMIERVMKLMSPIELETYRFEDMRYPKEAPDWFRARKTLIKKQPGFWSGLPVIEFGMELYKLLGQLGYTRMILTKGPDNNPMAWEEKVRWCREHVPDAGITITHDKGLVYGKVLYDDFPPYVMRWLKWRPRGKVLMLDAVHNQGFEHPNVFRCHRQPLAQQLEPILEFLGDL